MAPADLSRQAAQQRVGDLEIDGRGNFQVSLFALDEPNGFAGQFQQLNVVRDLIERNGTGGESIEQILSPHRLRGLHGPKIVAGNGLLDLCGQRAGGFLDRQMNGQSRGSGAVGESDLECAVDQCLRNQRTRRVVDGDPINRGVASERGEANAVGPARSAGANLELG